jgi:hypothetical protein
VARCSEKRSYHYQHYTLALLNVDTPECLTLCIGLPIFLTKLEQHLNQVVYRGNVLEGDVVVNLVSFNSFDDNLTLLSLLSNG